MVEIYYAFFLSAKVDFTKNHDMPKNTDGLIHFSIYSVLHLSAK